MKHVVFPKHLAADLVEELPQAYKDIREVLDLQRELAKPVLRLEPLAVMKGGWKEFAVKHLSASLQTFIS
jgi:tRNA-splicing ligase RtcB (3'-phosphate/5'-hydroxy nucleic acid ligase)